MADGFADAASQVALRESASVALFGSESERPLCDAIAESIRARGVGVINLAGRTTLREFIDLAAACRLFLTNDSPMHCFGAGVGRRRSLARPTIYQSNRSAGPRCPARCGLQPCLLRECPSTLPHDAGHTGSGSNGSHGPVAPMDTRVKIIDPASAAGPRRPGVCLKLVAGYFDVR
jgi:hypothetical protein